MYVKEADDNHVSLWPISDYCWTLADMRLCVVWDSQVNIKAIQQRVQVVKKGCNCVTGCATGRCGIEGIALKDASVSTVTTSVVLQWWSALHYDCGLHAVTDIFLMSRDSATNSNSSCEVWPWSTCTISWFANFPMTATLSRIHVDHHQFHCIRILVKNITWGRDSRMAKSRETRYGW